MKSFLLSIGLLFFAHDYFISVCDIEYNAEQKALEIAIKVTTHDLEDALDIEHLGTKLEPKDADDRIFTYLKKHFAVSHDGEKGELEWVGKQVELEDMWLYVQVNDVTLNQSLTVFNDLLCARFDEQQNRVNLKMPGQQVQGTVLSRNYSEHEFPIGGE